jgi:hypothetical protein
MARIQSYVVVEMSSGYIISCNSFSFDVDGLEEACLSFTSLASSKGIDLSINDVRREMNFKGCFFKDKSSDDYSIYINKCIRK